MLQSSNGTVVMRGIGERAGSCSGGSVPFPELCGAGFVPLVVGALT